MGLALLLVAASPGAIFAGAQEAARANAQEGRDDDGSNNDDFLTAQVFSNDTFLDGTTGLGDIHRIDIFVLKNVPAGKVINVSLQITNFNPQPGQGQTLLLEGWNKFHMDHLAWSNHEDQPARRPWEAISFLCVITGDYYISIKPIAGQGTTEYTLHIRSFDPPDVTDKVGQGGAYGQTIAGKVSSEKWYPVEWYKLNLYGENYGMNQYLYVNMTLPGAPDQRLLADLYVRNLEPETFSYWLNHSWWLDSFVQYEELHAAACCPGEWWYFLTVQAYNSSGGRSESFELRMAKTLVESDGDNHPKVATPVTYSGGNTTVTVYGNLSRGVDMFDWYKAYLHKGDGLTAKLTLLQKSVAIFRLSIYRDNLTSAFPEPGYDLMSSWTNMPAGTVLNKITSLTTNVSQEGWYYIGAIAQIGLVPSNVSLLADWTAQSAWASYQLEITLPDHTQAPFVSNPQPEVSMNEDSPFSGLRLLDTGQNGGIFSDIDISKQWGDELNFSAISDPFLQVSIGNDPESTVTLGADKDWNGDAAVTFTATDLYGKKASHGLTVHVLPSEDDPVVKAKLPDFSVTELSTNDTMTGINLDACFSDPDLPPFGNDALTYTIDSGSFPAAISGSRLDFGEAPDYPGYENTTVTVTVTATDPTSRSVSDTLVITVIDLEPGGPVLPDLPPVFDAANASFEVTGGELLIFELGRIFSDPQGGPLTFEYLGGAPGGHSVVLEADGKVRLLTAPAFADSVENLLFRATSLTGKMTTGEVKVAVLRIHTSPELVPGSLLPDPLKECRAPEGQPVTFSFCATDVDGGPSPLSCRWLVDGAPVEGASGWSFTWTPAFNQSGRHSVTAEATDGRSSVQAAWSVLVLDVNRLPRITETWPDAAAVARPGVPVTFGATASDPDSDPLSFTWSLPDGTVLKTEAGPTSTYSHTLQAGENLTLVLRLSDGRGGEANHTFTISAPAAAAGATTLEPTLDDSPNVCLWAAVAVIIAAVAGAAAMLVRRKR